MTKSKAKTFHVVPREGGWAVIKEEAGRATSVHNTQREAIEAARELARTLQSELIIHGRDGRIRERDSYSPDPLPPKEPRKVLFPEVTSETDEKAIKKAVRELLNSSAANGSNDLSYES